MSSVYFTVDIRGIWCCQTTIELETRDPASLSRHYVREQARHTLAHFSVLDSITAQDSVNIALARPMQPRRGLTVSGTVYVTVGRQNRRLALEHLRTEQRGDVDRQELLRRTTFLHRILSDPDLSRVWWIDRYPDRLGDLALLTASTQTLKPPHDVSHDFVRDEVIHFVDQLLNDIRTPQQREVFLRALTQTFRTLGSDDLQKMTSHWLRTTVSNSGAANSVDESSE